VTALAKRESVTRRTIQRRLRKGWWPPVAPAARRSPRSHSRRAQSEIDGTEDKDISITFPSGQTRQFTGQSLLLGNSLPNFWFHTTTAYDIVRQCGIEVGKRDFMGTPPAS
jgi:hypothetical protein